MRLLKLVPDDTNIHFLKWRVPFFIVSGLLVIASWFLIATQGLNLGVDFIGGQMLRVTLPRMRRRRSPSCAAKSTSWAMASRPSNASASQTRCRSG